jgi:predicted Fe-Mo cluster-binding NifX family protein
MKPPLKTPKEASQRYHDYFPQPVTTRSLKRWLGQLEKAERKLAWKLLQEVIYFSEDETKKILVRQNKALLNDLAKAGLQPKKLIYLQTDDAGSSSPMMLGMLRDAGRLQQRGCRFVDGRDGLRINSTTKDLEEGAIVYVDDFVGSGNQLSKARALVMESVVGNFSEFLLVPSICEEGYKKLTDQGIAVYTGHIHAKAERPLLENSHILEDQERTKLIEICKKIRRNTSLGYEGLATMVVLYRNAPNTIPELLRGSDKQSPFFGLFPRVKDLPIEDAVPVGG